MASTSEPEPSDGPERPVAAVFDNGWPEPAAWSSGSLAGRRHRTRHMSWRELVTGIYEGRSQQPGIAGQSAFYPAASAATIADAEAELNAVLPVSLRSLLLETNGVMDMMAIDGGDWFESMWLLWKIEEIVEQNRYYRAASVQGIEDRDFRDLVFFAGAGADGILFAFPVEDGNCAPRIVVWHPIMDALDGIAASLEDFLRGWLAGTISV